MEKKFNQDERYEARDILHRFYLVKDYTKNKSELGVPPGMLSACCTIAINLASKHTRNQSRYQNGFWKNVQLLIDEEIKKLEEINKK